MENNVYLSLGGNHKQTKILFKQVLELINQEIGQVFHVSSLYTSEPWGFDNETNQFYNQVLQLSTKLTSVELLRKTQEVEFALGRQNKTGNVYRDRPIDIDILIYGQKVINSSNLTIPHGLMHKRNFVLIPFAEIAPNFNHPVFKKTINDLLLLCKDELEVLKQ